MSWSNNQTYGAAPPAVRTEVEHRFVVLAEDARRRFGEAFGFGGVPSALVTLDRQCLLANDAFARLLGRAGEDLTGLDMSSVSHPEDVFVLAQRPMTGPAPLPVVRRRLLRTDGSVVHTDTTAQPVLDDNGRLIYSWVQLVDVTEAVADRERARRDHALLDAVLDGLGTGVAVLDAAGRLVLTNPAAVELLGLPEDGYFDGTDGTNGTQPGYGVFELDGRTPIPWHRLPLVRALSGEPSDGERMKLRHVKRPDGVTLSVSTRPLSPDAGFVGAVAVLHDVTAEYDAEQRLAAAEQRWRITLDQAPTGIALTELDGTWIHVNAALLRLLGFAREELMSLTLADLSHPDDLAESLDLLGRLMIGEIGDYTRQQRFLRGDGSVMWARVSVAMACNEHGEPRHVVSQLEDVTQAREQADRLRLDEQRFALAFDAAPVGVCIVDLHRDRRGVLIQVNPALCRMLGYSEDELLRQRLLDLTHPDDREVELDLYRQVFAEGRDDFTGDKRYVCADGRAIRVLVHSGVVRDAEGEPAYVVKQVQDITEQLEEQHRLSRLAMRDPLTTLANRRLLTERLCEAVDRVNQGDSSVTLFYADLNGFKPINDEFGHAAGDEVLRTVATRIEAAVRPGDTVARLGGDEFLVLCESTTGPLDTEQVCRRLRDAVSAPIRIAGADIRVEISIGVVTADEVGTDADALLSAADAAMYRDKLRRGS